MVNKRIPLVVFTALLGAMAIAFATFILWLIVRANLNTMFSFSFVVRRVSLVVLILGIALFAVVVFILYRVLSSRRHRKT